LRKDELTFRMPGGERAVFHVGLLELQSYDEPPYPGAKYTILEHTGCQCYKKGEFYSNLTSCEKFLAKYG
uniref:BAH domain-containing protein n=1 Tax=Gongylonema pulchrum TaxID=637853 RepID=A0A183EH57_9BILA